MATVIKELAQQDEKLLKYSARAARLSGDTMARSHMRRKKAINAVTKSAYATFQLPPW